MEKEKVKGVLDWPTPKGVKDIEIHRTSQLLLAVY